MISDSYSRLVWRTHDTVTGMELTEKECILYAEGRRQRHLGRIGEMDTQIAENNG